MNAPSTLKIKFFNTFLLFSLLVIVNSCYLWFTPKLNESINLPDSPVNLTEFNSEYDDFNITSPFFLNSYRLSFSSNRNSLGHDFDIIYKPMIFIFKRFTNEFFVKVDSAKIEDELGGNISELLNQINTSGNEFGPNLLFTDNSPKPNYTLMYATNGSGNYQICQISADSSGFSQLKEIDFLNSEYDDLYPNFNSDYSRLYFCSNRGGKTFDIYYAKTNSDLSLDQILSNKFDFETIKDTIVSSDFDDKCPFIIKDKLVFASNREGGFGGYDLYYCNLENGKWGKPINFGPKINSIFDEFRPVLINLKKPESKSMMMFSSNRTDGLGGFDLYYVGI